MDKDAELKRLYEFGALYRQRIEFHKQEVAKYRKLIKGIDQQIEDIEKIQES